MHLSLRPFPHGLQESTLVHSYLWGVSAKQWQFGGGFKCPVFCFLFSLLSSVVQSWDWQRRGKQAKESWVPRCCLLTGLEMLSISSSVFQWPLICSLWVLVPNHLSAKMIKNSGGAMDPIAASTVKLELIVRSSWKPGWRPTRHRHEGSDLRTVEIIWREITCLKS